MQSAALQAASYCVDRQNVVKMADEPWALAAAARAPSRACADSFAGYQREADHLSPFADPSDSQAPRRYVLATKRKNAELQHKVKRDCASLQRRGGGLVSQLSQI